MSSNEDSGAAIYFTLISKKVLKNTNSIFWDLFKHRTYSRVNVKSISEREKTNTLHPVQNCLSLFSKGKSNFAGSPHRNTLSGTFPGKLISSIWLSGSHQCKKFQEIWPLTGQKFFLPLCAGIFKQSTVWGLGTEQEQGCRTGPPVLAFRTIDGGQELSRVVFLARQAMQAIRFLEINSCAP